MNKKQKISLVITLSFLFIIIISGCVIQPEKLTKEKINLANQELKKGYDSLTIALEEVDQGNYDIAIQGMYDSRDSLTKSQTHIQELSGPEIDEIKSSLNLHVDLISILIMYTVIQKETNELETIAEKNPELALPQIERNIRNLEECEKKIDILRREAELAENEEVINITFSLNINVNDLAKKTRNIYDTTIKLVPGYIPISEKGAPVIYKLPEISPEIVPYDLVKFFDIFDINRNGKLDLSEAEDFYYWVEDNILYRYDDENEKNPLPGYIVGDGRPGIDYQQTPYETWKERQGDCDDMVMLEVAFHSYYGHKVYEAFVNANDPKEIDHTIAIVAVGESPEEVSNLLGGLVVYKLEDEYYMLVDNAYSDVFGYLSKGLKEGQFTIQKVLTLEEAFE